MPDRAGPMYTPAQWLVRSGKEQEFVQAWRGLADLFATLERKPYWGTLIRSLTNERLYYSFGPWGDDAAVAAMRSHPRIQEAFGDLMSLCDEASPGAYALVEHIVLEDDSAR